MCLYKRWVNNPRYKPNKKNGGIVPAIFDSRQGQVPYECGNCIECRKKKAREWRIRLMEDIKENTNGIFVTLTLNNESYSKLRNYERTYHYKENGKQYKKIIKNSDYKGYKLDNLIATTAVRLFTERWRKQNKKTVRHWLVTELGHNGTENIHMHGIIWTDLGTNEILKHWQFGYIWTGNTVAVKKGKLITTEYENYVNNKTINYIVKYITKLDKKHQYYRPIVLGSKGIGTAYLKTQKAINNKWKTYGTNEQYQADSGHKMALPTYYRRKIYTEDERIVLWQQNMDKQEAYVLGQKFDISKTNEWYIEATEDARKLNAEMGFGSYIKELKREIYEHERRMKLQEKRMPPAG